jgi:hypothetical protein
VTAWRAARRCPGDRRRSSVGRSRSGGQSLVEFSVLLPVFLVLLIGMLEFGFVFDHNISVSYASREGARVGAALANGGGALGCGAGQSPNAADVDPQVVAAVQRILTSPGSPIVLDRVQEIRIFRANSSGDQIGTSVNIWDYDPGGGPVIDGKALDFSVTSANWPACGRRNDYNPGLGYPHSIGVGIVYRYDLVTALGAVMRLAGGSYAGSLMMSDATVMALNPTNA